MDLTLVIMAAGIGSRFGGIKQLEPIGPNGEMIIDYSVYDAKRAGFSKVVFVIKKDIEQLFKEKVSDRLSKVIDCACVFQDAKDLPHGLICPPNREKPWGTAHAVLSAKNEAGSAFAVINADDFYGANAFKLLADFLKGLGAGGKYNYCMVGYELKNTLSEKGYVSRGVCRLDGNDNLITVSEKTHIEKDGDKIKYSEGGQFLELEEDTVVSMNCWGFTQEIFYDIENMFPDFYKANINDLEKAEFYLPSVVANLLAEGKATVKVLRCGEKWYGFTYREDKQIVINAIKDMISGGKYPHRLWG